MAGLGSHTKQTPLSLEQSGLVLHTIERVAHYLLVEANVVDVKG